MDKETWPGTVRILLVGATGAGKSSTGNTIFGRRVFTTNPKDTDSSFHCTETTSYVNGQLLSIVDTPGLFYPNKSDEAVEREIAKGAALAAPGPHVLLLVLRAGELTYKELEGVRIIQEMFGGFAARHTIALFTHGDDLSEGKSIDDILAQSFSFCSAILQYDGYLVFNNRDNDPSQVRELLMKINTMVQRNGGRYYVKDWRQRLTHAYLDGFSPAYATGRATGAVGMAAAVAAGAALGAGAAVVCVVGATRVGEAAYVGVLVGVLLNVAILPVVVAGAAVGAAAVVIAFGATAVVALGDRFAGGVHRAATGVFGFAVEPAADHVDAGADVAGLNAEVAAGVVGAVTGATVGTAAGAGSVGLVVLLRVAALFVVVTIAGAAGTFGALAAVLVVIKVVVGLVTAIDDIVLRAVRAAAAKFAVGVAPGVVVGTGGAAFGAAVLSVGAIAGSALCTGFFIAVRFVKDEAVRVAVGIIFVTYVTVAAILPVAYVAFKRLGARHIIYRRPM